MKVILEIQHACGTDNPRGVGYYTIELVQALLGRKKHEYELTFFDGGREMKNYLRAEEFFSKYGVPIHECNDVDYRVMSRDGSIFDAKTYNDLTGANGDVFHFMNFITIPEKLKGRMVVTVHDLLAVTHPELIMPNRFVHLVGFERLKKIKPYVIADSEYTKNELLKHTEIPENKIDVVYPSINKEEHYPDKEAGAEILKALGIHGEYILSVGVIESKKNIIRLIEAFNQIAENLSGLYLVLCGAPEWEDPTPILECANNSNYSDRIIFTGYVDAATKRKLYSNAMCLVFPSLCEGFGLPALEAMACGCPVITSNDTSVPEVVGDAGVLINPYSTEQIAHEIERLVCSESLRAQLITKGLSRAGMFSWGIAAERTENAYRMAYEFV